MRPGNVTARKKSYVHTLILSLCLIVVWQTAASAATTVTFGDNSGDDFPGTVQDAVIYEGAGYTNYNFGGRQNFLSGELASTAQTTRSLVRFTGIRSSLPADMVITSATMYLYCLSESNGIDYTIGSHRVLLNWGEGTSNEATEQYAVCWNDAQYSDLAWNVPGCDAASDVTGEDSTADRTATAEASRLITGTGWFAWDLTTAVQNWYSGQWSEYGVILINSGEGTANSMKQFVSSEHPDGDGYRPYLEVTYDTTVPGSACSYTFSAHGSNPYGVNRTDAGYQIGDCVQCHDTFDSSTCGVNQRMLFAPNNPASQSENFCFQCHKTTDSVQDGGITNYDYAATFGGAVNDLIVGPEGIYEAFNNSVSYHNLSDVLNFAKGHWGTTFTDESNACSACHNVHIARRNKNYKNNPFYTAVSKPSAHNQLHGDDPGERMSAYSSYYESPRWYNAPPREPANNYVEDGSNLPDFVTFCLDCHTKAVWSTTLGRNVRAIDWSTVGGQTGGDKHGWNISTSGRDSLDPPYDTAWTQTNGLVLCCTDCHEPHGSTDSVMLIRRKVNRYSMYAIESYDVWGWGPTWDSLCNSCHAADMRDIHHDEWDAPYPLGADPPHCSNCHYYTVAVYPIACTECHFHGGDDRWLDGRLPGWATYRRTF